MLVELAQTGKGGRDISAFSKHATEEEVLLMPGTRIRMNEVSWETIGGAPLKVLQAEEV